LKSVYIIILSYDDYDDLEMTITSIKQQDYKSLRIVISDNGSTKIPFEKIMRDHNDITLFENKANLGWAGGNNIGIEYALKNNADYILLSNDDICLTKNHIISDLVTALETPENELTGLMGASVNYFSNVELNHNSGWNMYPKMEKKNKFFNRQKKGLSFTPGSKYDYVDSPDGCFFLIKSEVFKKIGLLNSSLFMYADEIEFAMRAWRNGFRSVVNKNTVVLHKTKTEDFPNSPFSSYYRTRNLLFLIKTNNYSLPFLFQYLKGIVRESYSNLLLSNKPASTRLKIQYAILRGFKDGLFNNLGNRY
jgi:GT2 family glycosyltransferase